MVRINFVEMNDLSSHRSPKLPFPRPRAWKAYRLRPAETTNDRRVKLRVLPSRCPPLICMKLACYGTRPQSGPRAFPPTRAAAAVLQKAPRLFRSMSARAPLTERAYCAVQTGDTHNAPLTKRVTVFITRIYGLVR